MCRNMYQRIFKYLYLNKIKFMFSFTVQTTLKKAIITKIAVSLYKEK